jgi:hypothetical protein
VAGNPLEAREIACLAVAWVLGCLGAEASVAKEDGIDYIRVRVR